MKLKLSLLLLAFAPAAWGALVAGNTTNTLTTSSVSPWIVPAGVTSVQVQMWGGGGGGGGAGAIGSTAAAGGGGGGGYTFAVLPVTPFSMITFTVGAGGTGGTILSVLPVVATNGVDGGSTTFGTATTANGGKGGVSKAAILSSGTGAGGAGGVGGSFNGGAGATGSTASGGNGGGGGGSGGSASNGNNGTAPNGAVAVAGGGNGGNGGHHSDGGSPTIPPGGGGGGGATNSPSGALAIGGTGADGRIVLSYNLPVPVFSGLTGSQSISEGATAISLAGTLSAMGPLYPASGETITVTINGNAQTTTVDSTGDFSFNYNLSAIPASVTPYTIIYSYAGSAALFAASNTTTSLTVTQGNHAPVAGADALSRVSNTRTAKVLKTALLSNDSDDDSDPISLTGVGSATPSGATVVISGTFVIYTAPATNSGNGGFAYSLSDGPGGHTTTGTVTVTETGSAPVVTNAPPNTAASTTSGGNNVLSFIGVSGRQYRIQYTTNTVSPYLWSEFSPLAVFMAPANGVIIFVDTNPPPPARLYRAISHP